MKNFIAGLLALLLVGSASAASADAIPITAGTVDLAFLTGLTQATLSSPGTLITATGINPSSIAFDAGAIGPINPHGSLAISTQTDPNRAPELIGGMLYPSIDYVDGALRFFLSPFEAPATANSVAFFQTPFTFTGNITEHDPSGTVLSGNALAGQGVASILASATPGAITGFSTQSMSFQFTEPALSATPEPASLVLLGTAVAGFWAPRLRRFRKH